MAKRGDASAKAVLVGAGDEENLSVRYLAAALIEAGHEASVVPLSRREDVGPLVDAVKRLRPDLIGVSIAFQSMAATYFDAIDQVRKGGYGGHIVVGGHFPTFDYREILESQSGIDSVGRYEGEATIVALADHLARGLPISSVPNLVHRGADGLVENGCVHMFQELDGLPTPLRDENPQTRLGERFATLVSSRGCWHSSCLYCSIGAFHAKKAQRFAIRSPKNIAAEIARLCGRGVRLFQFHDDNFLPASRDDAIARLAEIKDALTAEGIVLRDVAFLIKARPDTINEEVASALSDFGVVGVFLGVENASETGLKALIRGARIRDVEAALHALRGRGISVTYNLLIFHPEATLDEIGANMEFAKNNAGVPFDFGRAEVVAGSPLERMLKASGRLRGAWPNWDYEVSDPVVERMFNINRLTFRRQGSEYPRLAESAIALSYQAHILRRLHPGPMADSLASEAERLIWDINLFVIGKMTDAYGLAVRRISEEDVDGLYESLSDGCRSRLGQTEKLSKRMLRLQLAERVFEGFGVRGAAQTNEGVRRILTT